MDLEIESFIFPFNNELNIDVINNSIKFNWDTINNTYYDSVGSFNTDDSMLVTENDEDDIVIGNLFDDMQLSKSKYTVEPRFTYVIRSVR